MKKVIIMFVVQLIFTTINAQTFTVQSPDKQISFLLSVSKQLSFSVKQKEQTVIGNSFIILRKGQNSEYLN